MDSLGDRSFEGVDDEAVTGEVAALYQAMVRGGSSPDEAAAFVQKTMDDRRFRFEDEIVEDHGGGVRRVASSRPVRMGLEPIEDVIRVLKADGHSGVRAARLGAERARSASFRLPADVRAECARELRERYSTFDEGIEL